MSAFELIILYELKETQSILARVKACFPNVPVQRCQRIDELMIKIKDSRPALLLLNLFESSEDAAGIWTKIKDFVNGNMVLVVGKNPQSNYGDERVIYLPLPGADSAQWWQHYLQLAERIFRQNQLPIGENRIKKDDNGQQGTLPDLFQDVSETGDTEVELEKRNRLLTELNAILKSISESLDLAIVLKNLFTNIFSMTGLPGCCIISKYDKNKIIKCDCDENGNIDIYQLANNNNDLFYHFMTSATDELKKGHTIYHRDLQNSTRPDLQNLRTGNLHSVYLIPIILESNLWGVICLYNYTKIFKLPDLTLQILKTVAVHSGVAIRNACLHTELTNTWKNISAQYSAARELTVIRCDKARKIGFEKVLKLTSDTIGAEKAGLFLSDNQNNWQLVAQIGFENSDLVVIAQKQRSVAINIWQKYIEMLDKGSLLLTNQLTLPDFDLKNTLGAESILLAPIRGRKGLNGVLTFVYVDKKMNPQEDNLVLADGIASQFSSWLESDYFLQQLESSEKKYRQLFEESIIPLCILRDDRTFEKVNQEFLKQFNLLPENVLKLKFEELIAKGYRNKFIEFHQKRLRSNKKTNGRTSIRIKTGSEPVKFLIVQIGKIPGTSSSLVSIVDITKNVELARKWNETRTLASIGRLTASIAHEIRSPLGAINTAVGIISEKGPFDARVKELLDIIHTETSRLTTTVNYFLKYTRPNPFRPVFTDITELADSTIKQFEFNLDNRYNIVKQYEPHVPLVMVDSFQMQQVFENLIKNAIEAMPDGGKLTVTISSCQRTTKDDIVVISIADTGRGIKEEHQGRVFELFYSTRNNGTGIGLAICQRNVLNHKGVIRLESTPGFGTKFIIELPVNFQMTSDQDKADESTF